MVHVKTILDTRRQKVDGSYPIIFRITNYNRIYTITSGMAVEQHQWDSSKMEVSKLHPNAQLINTTLSKKYFEIQRALLKLEDADEFSIADLKQHLEGKTVPVKQQITFKSFSNQLITEMMQINHAGNALVYQTAVNRFINYCGNPAIKFSAINYTTLQSFSNSLQASGLKPNSISNYLRTLRAIYNKAIRAKLVDRSKYPFLDVKIRSERTIKRAVLKEDVFKLTKLDLSNYKAKQRAINHFLLSFYLIGISFTDLAYLKPENIIDGRLVYKRRKTHKHYSIKIFPQVTTILNQFGNANSKYLLPILPNHVIEDSLEAKKLIHQWIKTTNKYLKRLGIEAGIAGTLTTYVARHTFATTAKKLGYSNELIAEALGHEYGNRITNIYLDSFDKEVVDEMHIKVIS